MIFDKLITDRLEKMCLTEANATVDVQRVVSGDSAGTHPMCRNEREQVALAWNKVFKSELFLDLPKKERSTYVTLCGIDHRLPAPKKSNGVILSRHHVKMRRTCHGCIS